MSRSRCRDAARLSQPRTGPGAPGWQPRDLAWSQLQMGLGGCEMPVASACWAWHAFPGGQKLALALA